MTKNQEAIRRLFKVERDDAGNMPSLPGIFPDYLAPIVRTGCDGVRELVMARWGMLGPASLTMTPVTNIRNVGSPHWRRWLTPEAVCIVPFTSFCEYTDTRPRKTPTWFAVDESRLLICFAGIWTTWNGTRGTKPNPVVGRHRLYGFLTCQPNAEVDAIHPKAMPVDLTDEVDSWLHAPWDEAIKLLRPLSDSAL